MTAQELFPPSAPTRSAEEQRARRRLDLRGALIGLAVAVVVGAILALNLLSSDSGSTATPKINNLTFGVLDTYRRTVGTSLGRADTGQPWISVTGHWAVKDGQAFCPTPRPNHYNLTVVNTHTGDGSVQVTLTKLSDGAGLVFRYRNALNYWMVAASPRVATWTLRRFDAGKLTSVAKLGLVNVQNVTTVGVQMRGPQIDVTINGLVVRSVASTTLQTAPWVGLVGFGDQTRSARWIDFVATGAAPPFTPQPALKGPRPRPRRRA